MHKHPRMQTTIVIVQSQLGSNTSWPRTRIPAIWHHGKLSCVNMCSDEAEEVRQAVLKPGEAPSTLQGFHPHPRSYIPRTLTCMKAIDVLTNYQLSTYCSFRRGPPSLLPTASQPDNNGIGSACNCTTARYSSGIAGESPGTLKLSMERKCDTTARLLSFAARLETHMKDLLLSNMCDSTLQKSKSPARDRARRCSTPLGCCLLRQRLSAFGPRAARCWCHANLPFSALVVIEMLFDAAVRFHAAHTNLNGLD